MSFTPEKWTITGFLDQFMDIHEHFQDRSFTFILGPGASAQSGVPSATEIVYSWIADLQRRHDPDPKSHPVEDWATADNLKIPGFEYPKALKFFPQVFRRRFGDDPEEAYAELESILEGKRPSFGYYILAQILAKTSHRIVITNSFDNLIETAVHTCTSTTPLVVGHDFLNHFLGIKVKRPTIAKTRGSLLLGPQFYVDATDDINPGWVEAFKALFERSTPVVIGCSQADISIIATLEKLSPKSVLDGIFWCHDESTGEPGDRILKILENQSGVLIPIPGFDELMLQLGERLDLPLLAEEIEKRARKTARRYRQSLEQILVNSTDPNRTFGNFGSAAEARSIADGLDNLKNWWLWEIRARAENDPVKREAIYRRAVGNFPESAELLNRFAGFLVRMKKYDEAEDLYRKAIEIAPDKARHAGTLANFLTSIRKKHDEAEEYYRLALELDPLNPLWTGLFASFLCDIRKKFDEAEYYYQRALDLDPDDAFVTASYGNFLLITRQDIDGAHRLYLRALELDPTNAIVNAKMANFMAKNICDFAQAEHYYRKTLDLDPERANVNSNFAGLLISLGRFDEAKHYLANAARYAAGDFRQVHAEIALYNGLIALIDGGTDSAALSRLKALFEADFVRFTWNFDTELAKAAEYLSADDLKLYTALAGAILYKHKTPDLFNFRRYRDIPPASLHDTADM